MSNKSNPKTLSEQLTKYQPKENISKAKNVLMALIPLGIAIVARVLSNIIINIKYASRLSSIYGNDYILHVNENAYTAGEKILLLFLSTFLSYVIINKYLDKTQLGFKQDKKIHVVKDNMDFRFIFISGLLGFGGALFIGGINLMFGTSADNIYKLEMSSTGFIKVGLLIISTYLGAKYKELIFRRALPVVAETTNMKFVIFNAAQALLFAVTELNFLALIPNFVLGYLFGEYFSVIKDYKKTTNMHLAYAFTSLLSLILLLNYNFINPTILLVLGIISLFSVIAAFYFMLNGGND